MIKSSETFRASDVTPMRNPETERMATAHRKFDEASHAYSKALKDNVGASVRDAADYVAEQKEAYNRAADEFANAIRDVANAESDNWVTVTAAN